MKLYLRFFQDIQFEIGLWWWLACLNELQVVLQDYYQKLLNSFYLHPKQGLWGFVEFKKCITCPQFVLYSFWYRSVVILKKGPHTGNVLNKYEFPINIPTNFEMNKWKLLSFTTIFIPKPKFWTRFPRFKKPNFILIFIVHHLKTP